MRKQAPRRLNEPRTKGHKGLQERREVVAAEFKGKDHKRIQGRHEVIAAAFKGKDRKRIQGRREIIPAVTMVKALKGCREDTKQS